MESRAELLDAARSGMLSLLIDYNDHNRTTAGMTVHKSCSSTTQCATSGTRHHADDEIADDLLPSRLRGS